MGNLFGKITTDACPLEDDINCDCSRSPTQVYNGAQPSGMESAQRDETEPTMRTLTFWRQTTPYMPNVLTTPTNVSSPILNAGPSAPSVTSTCPTTLESTLDDIAEQPTRQMNEPDVTPNLFSPTTPEPTIIPETPIIFETPMDRTPAPQLAQLSSDRLPSERKTREDSPPHRRSQHTQSRLDDGNKTTFKLATFEESEDENKDEEPTNIVRSLRRSNRIKDRPRSKDRREARTSSEDPTRRRRKKTASRRVQTQALSSDESSSSADDYVDTFRPTQLMKPPKYDGTSAFETFYDQFLNCSVYNQWTKTDQLAYLKGALQKEAGQVLWDYGPEVTNSFTELVRTLKGRFGGANQSHKFRMEIRNRRRKDGESLQSLHSDV